MRFRTPALSSAKMRHRANMRLAYFFSCILAVVELFTLVQSENLPSLIKLPTTEDLASLSSTTSYLRDRPPSTYVLNVDSFSSLVGTQADSYLSDIFQAAGYSWTLILYPSGNKKEDGANHVSLYLGINYTYTLPQNWEVYAELKFFIYNKQQKKYYTVQESEIRRFDGSKTEWGIAKLMPVSTFNNPNNGYLVGDSCRFGIEIFVVKQFEKSESLSFIQKPSDGSFSWRIISYSTLDKSEFYFSDEFTAAGRNWKLQIAPGGDGAGWGNSLSIYLLLSDSANLRPNERVYARGKLSVLNQNQSKNREGQVKYWFSKAVPSWGYRKFMPLDDLRDASKGFVVNDRLTIQLEFDQVSKTQYFP